MENTIKQHLQEKVRYHKSCCICRHTISTGKNLALGEDVILKWFHFHTCLCEFVIEQFAIIVNLTVKSNRWITFNWFCFTTFCDWFKKTRVAYSTNQIQNQSRLGCAGHVYLLRVLIGSLCCLRLLRLAIVIAFAIEKRSKLRWRKLKNSLTLSFWLSFLLLCSNLWSRSCQRWIVLVKAKFQSWWEH